MGALSEHPTLFLLSSFGPALLATTGRDDRSRPGARGDGHDDVDLPGDDARTGSILCVGRVLQPVRARLAARAAA